MKLGVSNLAWKDDEDLESIIKALVDNSISHVEIVLGKHIDWQVYDWAKLYAFKDTLKAHNISIASTQSITYGVELSNLESLYFQDHLSKVLDVCNHLEINRIVLGAPSLRKGKSVGLLTLLPYINTMLQKNNQVLLLEPNTSLYGGDYFYTVQEIVEFITGEGYTNIATMVDTHNVLLENQDLITVYNTYRDVIKHIHISETNLKGFTPTVEHTRLAHTLLETGYDELIVYEAKPSLNFLEELNLFTKTYNI